MTSARKTLFLSHWKSINIALQQNLHLALGLSNQWNQKCEISPTQNIGISNTL